MLRGFLTTLIVLKYGILKEGFKPDAFEKMYGSEVLAEADKKSRRMAEAMSEVSVSGYASGGSAWV